MNYFIIHTKVSQSHQMIEAETEVIASIYGEILFNAEHDRTLALRVLRSYQEPFEHSRTHYGFTVAELNRMKSLNKIATQTHNNQKGT